MKNLALGKIPFEQWHTPEKATDGEFSIYNANSGYAKAHWPCYYTIDLGEEYDIETLQFLLYDKDDREHKYRLLSSINNHEWSVHYDTNNDGFNGWQYFRFEDKIKARYIKLHAIYGSKARSFHIIEFQVFDINPENQLIVFKNEHVLSCNNSAIPLENGDGIFISRKIFGLINELKKIVEKYKDQLNTDYLNGAITELSTRLSDVNKIEKEASSIRREIVNPISRRIDLSNILQWISIVFGIVGIISFILQLCNK
jgi:hypothetical protein